jgi:hypothetical protein
MSRCDIRKPSLCCFELGASSCRHAWCSDAVATCRIKQTSVKRGKETKATQGEKRGPNTAYLLSTHLFTLAHLFEWIPVQTVNWAVCQCHHHITWGRHRCSDRQFGRCDTYDWRRGHKVWLMLPQLQKQIDETCTNNDHTAFVWDNMEWSMLAWTEF